MVDIISNKVKKQQRKGNVIAMVITLVVITILIISLLLIT